MMNPDITDSAWRKEREALWDHVSRPWLEDFKKREIKVLKGLFMGEPYEYGNQKKYGEGLAWSWQWLWKLSPIQNKQSWKKFVLEDSKIYQGSLNYKIEESLFHLACLQADSNASFGWDFPTHLEVTKYVLGDHFVKGASFFEGIPCRYIFRIGSLHMSWATGATDWLLGQKNNDHTVITFLFDYWKDAVEQSHSAYFEKKASRLVCSEQRQIQYLMRFAYDFEARVFEGARENSLSSKGIEIRLAFGRELKDYFESRERPLILQNLYDFATSKSYERPYVWDYMPADRDISEEEVKAGG